LFQVLLDVTLFQFLGGTVLGITTELLLDLKEGVHIIFEQLVGSFRKMSCTLCAFVGFGKSEDGFGNGPFAL
jgi:hypothetical protein